MTLRTAPASSRRASTTRSDYRLRITYHAAVTSLEIDDPYRYGRVLTDFDLHLFGEGTHHRAFEKLGAHRISVGTTTGVHFAVWAPNADRVSLIGDFNGWDGRVHPMRLLVAVRHLGDLHAGPARRRALQVRNPHEGRRRC